MSRHEGTKTVVVRGRESVATPLAYTEGAECCEIRLFRRGITADLHLVETRACSAGIALLICHRAPDARRRNAPAAMPAFATRPAAAYRVVAVLDGGEDQGTTGTTIHDPESEGAQRRAAPEVEIAPRLERLHCLP